MNVRENPQPENERSFKSKEEEAAAWERLRSLRGRHYLEESIEFYRKALVTVALREGRDLSDYSRACLRAIDRDIEEDAGRVLKRGSIESTSNTLWTMYHMLGSYFGTVIVEKLGGHWRTPNIIRYWQSRFLWNPSFLFDYWYVELNGHNIPVFKIVRWRCDGSGRVKSLAEVYERIASGRSWRD
jgi:hypothetical protein